ncbi:potassium channel subfamily K member 17 isoform X1 [Bos mutus]|uniref:potassium channel subfamily K member 17 isoform X1 n=1 Tax=Bos mutus TaxID=72004 RepID=UPI0038B66A22
MAPDSRLSASPAKSGWRAWDASERGVQGCAVPVPSTLLLLLTYLTYLVLGTCVFWALESPAAHDSSKRFQRDKWELLRNFTCLDGQALDSLIRGIIEAYKNGDIVLGNTTSMGRWEFVGSFFFSVSTITTIASFRGITRTSSTVRPSSLDTAWEQNLGLTEDVLNRLLPSTQVPGRLREPEPPHDGRPALLHLLCSRGDPAQPRGAQPPGALHAAGGTPLCPQAGGRLEGPGQGPVAGRLQRPPVGPPAFPAVAPAALQPHGRLDLRGGLLLLLRHSQHRGLRRLRDWNEPLPELPAVVPEHSVSVDPLWDGVAGIDHQTDPLLTGGSTRIILLLSSEFQGELQAPKLESGPG